MLEPCCRSTGKLFQLYSINGNAKRFNYYPHIKSLGDELNHNTAGFSWRAHSAQSPRRNPGQIPKPPQLALTVSPSWIVELFILPLRQSPDSLLEKSTSFCLTQFVSTGESRNAGWPVNPTELTVSVPEQASTEKAIHLQIGLQLTGGC